MTRRRLMPHQRTMLVYATRERHPALFCEMRLGKSMPTIRRCKMYAPRGDDLRVLVVAPNSALGSWAREFDLEGEADYVFLRGTRKQRLALLHEGHRWCLLNKEGWLALPEIANRTRCEACRGRGTVANPRVEKRQRCRACRGMGSVPSADRPVQWDAVVWDESTAIKSPRARVTRFYLECFRDVPHRWALTGTPAPEGPLDLWCQMAWLDGIAFGCRSYWSYRTSYFAPNWSRYGWAPKKGAEARISRALGERALVMSRREAGMGQRKVRERREVHLPRQLQKAYATAEAEFLLEFKGEEIDRTVFAGARWQWLRQMCGGFVDHELVWDGKIKELVRLLQGELAGQTVIIWFAYNQEIEACLTAVRKAGRTAARMIGDDKPIVRYMLQHGLGRDIDVLLIQQEVAKFGMDLSAADAAIYFSNSASALTRTQSEDRIVHPRKSVPLLYVDLVVPGTVDEDVAEIVRDKRFRSDVLLRRAVRERMRARGAA